MSGHELILIRLHNSQDYVITLLFANDSDSEDRSPSPDKVSPLKTGNGFLVKSIQGLRIQATRRMDNQGGYDITRIGPYRISSSSTIFLSDPGVLAALKPSSLVAMAGAPVVEDHIAPVQVTFQFTPRSGQAITLSGVQAAFGPTFLDSVHSSTTGKLSDVTGAAMSADGSNPFACQPIRPLANEESTNTTIFVTAYRGECTFLQKMTIAAQAGATGLLVLSDEEDILVPSAELADLALVMKQVPVALLPKSASDKVRALLRDSDGDVAVKVIRNPNYLSLENPRDTVSELERRAAISRDLAETPVVVNGYWLVNCRLTFP